MANLKLCAILTALGLNDLLGWRALRRGAAGQDGRHGLPGARSSFLLRTAVPRGALREMGRLQRPPAEAPSIHSQSGNLSANVENLAVRGCAGQGAACARAVRPPRSAILWPHHATPARCRSTSGCGSRRGWTGSTSMRLTRQDLRRRHSCQQGPEAQSDGFKRCLR